MTDRDCQMVFLGMLLADVLLLTMWWALGRRNRRAAHRASEKALAEAQAFRDGIQANAPATEARR